MCATSLDDWDIDIEIGIQKCMGKVERNEKRTVLNERK